MNCPKDQAELSRRIYEADIEVDECGVCHGVWLDAGELTKIQETTEKDYTEELSRPPDYVGAAFALASARNEAPRSCPRCGEALDKRDYGFSSSVMIDSCVRGHGVWLDAGELSSLEQFFERARAETQTIRQGFLARILGSFG